MTDPSESALRAAAEYKGHDWHGITADKKKYYCHACRELAALLDRYAQAAVEAERQRCLADRGHQLLEWGKP